MSDSMMPLMLTAAGLVIVMLGFFRIRQRQRHAREIDQLRQRMNRSDDQRRIAEQRYRDERGEAAMVTAAFEKIPLAVVVLSDRGYVRRINPAATDLLSIDAPSSDDDKSWRLIERIREPELIDAIAATTSDRPQSFEFERIIDETHIAPTQIATTQIAPTQIVGKDAAVRHVVGVAAKLDDDGVVVWFSSDDDRRVIESRRRDMIANLSHELKTPLSAVKGYAETAAVAIEDDDGESATYFLGQLRTQCVRLEQLIGDMLQMARMQSESATPVIDRFGLAGVIGDAMDAVSVIAESKRIVIDVETSMPVDVRSDREAVLTVVGNLLSNAVRYTAAEGKVKIGWTAQPGWFNVWVCDNGVGIDEADRERIFQRFYRVRRIGRVDRHKPGGDGDGNDHGGTGIGLSIVRTLVQRLGGSVTVQSEVGVGSRFEVRLPDVATDRPGDVATDRPGDVVTDRPGGVGMDHTGG